MATTTRSLTKSNTNEEAQEAILLPDMWVTHYHIRRNGRPLKPYFLNVRTGKKFSSKEALYRYFRRVAAQSKMYTEDEDWLNRETAEIEEDEMCSRCEEFGHHCLTCPYPMIYKINPYAGMNIRRCSRCHYLGHNVRTCRRAVQN